MREKIFSSAFDSLLRRDPGKIINIEPDLTELIVCGLASQQPGMLIWLVDDFANLDLKRARLRAWFDLLGETAPAICFHPLPFQDPYINNSPDHQTVIDKVELMNTLMTGETAIIITTLTALNIRCEKDLSAADLGLSLNKGMTLPRNELIDRALRYGYVNRDVVADRGDLSWRGSVLDIFPPNQPQPVRIEFFGSTVESLRIFSSATQRSLNILSEIDIPINRYFLKAESFEHHLGAPATESALLTEFAPDVRIVASHYSGLLLEYEKRLEHYDRIYRMLEDGKRKSSKKPDDIFGLRLDARSLIDVAEEYDSVGGRVELKTIPKSLNRFEVDDFDLLNKKIEQGFSLHVFTEERDIEKTERLDAYLNRFKRHNMPLPCSFENRRTNTIFIAFSDFKYFRPLAEYEAIDSTKPPLEIQVDDIVVHLKHGVGRFMGFQRLDFDGIGNEYLKIQYGGGEFLYVPVSDLDVLSKYSALEAKMQPKLDALGGKTWRAKQKRAQKSIIHFARELLDLYARRRSIHGQVYAKEAELEGKLAQDFSFVETRDQQAAIAEVMRDLEADYPMDRLICGDVSFGKTEVAIRAALRVIANGRQVAMLCPTTILALQHFNTFAKRFADFPVRLGLLSRMVPPGKRRTLIEALAEGSLDMVIGTHALLSEQIKFRRLGLYIVDEEQRFGVFQKEKIKKNRPDVDVLTLSATPIPRTLTLSFSGVQDISIIESPPIGRLAIKNYVGFFSREILVSAVLNELARQGQVFIVYNNIQRIFSFRDKIQGWLPGASISVIHAQMSTARIEANLLGFIKGDTQVLLSTTIIENGIDIPLVNTLIVVGADKFGLTQLYQLRGRIGRSSRQGLAYFLVDSARLSDQQRLRLDAIREFSALGSGYKIAEFDLKIRGAGTLLGNRQHGHIEALGFDYYQKMLEETVASLKGEGEASADVDVNFHFSYTLESDYIPNTSERIAFYRKILESSDLDELEVIRAELEDRYGKTPDKVERIFFAAAIKMLARRCSFREIDVFPNHLEIRLDERAETMPALKQRLLNLFDGSPGDLDHLTLKFKNYRTFIKKLSGIC